MAEITLQWALLKLAAQAKEIRELENAVTLLEYEITGNIPPLDAELEPDIFDGTDPCNTGTHKAIIQAGKQCCKENSRANDTHRLLGPYSIL